MVRYALQMSLLAIVALYAWKKGGAPERGVAVTLVAMSVADPFYHVAFGKAAQLETIDLGHLIIDLAAFYSILTIALRANRLWILLAASAQLLSLMSHLVRVLSLDMWGWTYAVLTRAPSYLLIILLAIGTLLHSRRTALKQRI
ncbi:hypothetical protein [Allopontixanthobacter sediminis]|uniref:hypothetical protein n=1 Tax=Allopontixanthobacter sediminis TaxID=1689985 RepID=UPI001926234E|nr:hypothetical protein [Allopontixanthobacter sediminis]